MDAKKAKAAALQASIAARLAALKAKKAGGTPSAATAPSAAAAPPAAPAAAAATKKAKTYEIDLSDTTPLFKKEQLAKKAESSKPKKKVNPYLAHLEPADDDAGGAAAGKGGKGKKDGGAKATDAAAGLPKGRDASMPDPTDAEPAAADGDGGELLLDGQKGAGWPRPGPGTAPSNSSNPASTRPWPS